MRQPSSAVVIFVAVVGAGLSREIAKAVIKPGEQAQSPWRRPRVEAPRRQQQRRLRSASRTVTLERRRPRPVQGRGAGRRPDHRLPGGHRRRSPWRCAKPTPPSSASFPRARNTPAGARPPTASARYAPVRLNRVEINGITVRDVEAAVMPDDALKTNLLGMTFLSRMKLTPRPRPAGAGTIRPVGLGYCSGHAPEIRCSPSPSRR